MAAIEEEGEGGDNGVDNYLDVIDQDGGEVKSTEDKLRMRISAIKDLTAAEEAIREAMDKTACGYCIRDLNIAELLVCNIKLLMLDLVEKGATEKKENGEG